MVPATNRRETAIVIKAFMAGHVNTVSGDTSNTQPIDAGHYFLKLLTCNQKVFSTSSRNPQGQAYFSFKPTNPFLIVNF